MLKSEIYFSFYSFIAIKLQQHCKIVSVFSLSSKCSYKPNQDYDRQFFLINSCAIKFKINEIVNSKNGWKCEEVRCANRGLQKQEFYEW